LPALTLFLGVLLLNALNPLCFGVLDINFGVVFTLSVIDLTLGDLGLAILFLPIFLGATLPSLNLGLFKLILEKSFYIYVLLLCWSISEFCCELVCLPGGVVVYLI
jgi:hypothetical protein